MSDIVERLRKWASFGYGYEASRDMKEAADRIAQLEAAIALARAETLEEAAKVADATTAYDDNLQKAAGCGTTGQRIAAAIRALVKP